MQKYGKFEESAANRMFAWSQQSRRHDVADQKRQAQTGSLRGRNRVGGRTPPTKSDRRKQEVCAVLP